MYSVQTLPIPGIPYTSIPYRSSVAHSTVQYPIRYTGIQVVHPDIYRVNIIYFGILLSPIEKLRIQKKISSRIFEYYLLGRRESKISGMAMK